MSWAGAGGPARPGPSILHMMGSSPARPGGHCSIMSQNHFLLLCLKKTCLSCSNFVFDKMVTISIDVLNKSFKVYTRRNVQNGASWEWCETHTVFHLTATIFFSRFLSFLSSKTALDSSPTINLGCIAALFFSKLPFEAFS